MTGRQWRVANLVALIAGPLLAVVVAGWFYGNQPNVSYSVDQLKNRAGGRLVSVVLGNRGRGPAENLYGWIEFPVGEECKWATAPEPFEIRANKEWKRFKWGGLFQKGVRRVYFRASRVQPGIRYTLMFACKAEVDLNRHVEVVVVDDTGAARGSL